MNARNSAAGLLLFTGVAHAAEWALRSHATPMLVLGALYFALALWLRRAGKAALVASIALPTRGGIGGAQQLGAAPSVDPVLAAMVAIDAVVVVCGIAAWRRGDAPAAIA